MKQRNLNIWPSTLKSSADYRENATADVLTSVPSQMLEAFIPGFGILSRSLEVSLGIDVTAVVTILFIIAAFVGAFTYAGRAAWRNLKPWCTCTISIMSNDKLYEQVMYWISRQNLSSSSRALKATTSKKRDEAGGRQRGRQGPSNFYFAEIESSTPPEYTPAYGWHRLWYQGRLVLLNREQEKQQMVDLSGWGSGRQEKEYLHLTCLGWSAAPLKRLLMECKRLDAELHRSTTTVRRSAQGQAAQWVAAITRPSRSIDTVYMDENVKTSLMDDVREYLDPSTPIFYARRGIPYRRGYLFHGPPGTGKTSLSFALAGTFGFELFTVSLKEPFMSEHKLTQLFSSLPSRCIVLLEDVDSAGLEKRDNTKPDEEKEDDEQESQPKVRGGVRIRNETRQVGPHTVTTPTAEGVTLSGLLNAIDGVASQEGRILVMTTNDPESLDGALIRPGRIDMQVYFGYASKYYTQQIFYKMFAKDDPQDSAGKPHLDSERKNSSEADANASADTKHLEEMASAFARILPDKILTPAEIQGFLLTRRKDPQKAIDDAPAWRDAVLAARAAGRNIVAHKAEQSDDSPSEPGIKASAEQ